MAIKTFKPTTPSRRHMTVSAFEGIDKKAKPEQMCIRDRISSPRPRNSVKISEDSIFELLPVTYTSILSCFIRPRTTSCLLYTS